MRSVVCGESASSILVQAAILDRVYIMSTSDLRFFVCVVVGVFLFHGNPDVMDAAIDAAMMWLSST